MDVRRVVTGRAADGLSRIVADGPPPHVLRPYEQGGDIAYIWAADEVPVVPSGGHETTREDQDFFPPTGGARFLLISYEPGFGTAPPNAPVHGDFEAMAAGATFENLLMHATATVDCGVVVSGELTLILDSGDETTLRTGDVVIQNGTVHGWRNNGDRTAVVAFVIIGARG